MDGCASSKGKSGHSSVRSGKGDADGADGGKRKRGRPRKGESAVMNPVRVIFSFRSRVRHVWGVVEIKGVFGLLNLVSTEEEVDVN